MTTTPANKDNQWHYNKNLKKFARELRNNPTKSEKRLWYQVLKDQKMLGYQFLRQRPILNYIADFMCKELMLVIELDGFSHEYEEVSQKNMIKTQDLEAVGFTVLRFRDEEVFKDVEYVGQQIVAWIESDERMSGA